MEPGAPRILLLHLPSVARPGATVRLTAVVLDAAGNTGLPVEGEIALEDPPEGVEVERPIVLSAEMGGRITVPLVAREPGLVRLFRVGWHLLANLPVEAAGRLVSVFADETVRSRLGEKPWVLTEVDALLGSPDFEETVAARNFEDARETLKILGIALEAEAVVTLCVLTDGVPQFARVLEGRPPEGAVMTYASRDFSTMSDLMAVHRFLDDLDDQIRL